MTLSICLSVCLSIYLCSYDLNALINLYIITQSQLSNILAVYFSINTFDRTDLKVYAHRIKMY